MRDERYYLDNRGGFFDLVADPLQQQALSIDANEETLAAHRRLSAVLESLPPDNGPPFPEFADAERLLREHQAAVRRSRPTSH